MVAAFHLAGRAMGPSQPCFVIAEAGVNHNGDRDMARRLVDAAADAGADCVKFQTFKAERLASLSAPKAAYQLKTTGADESQLEMLRRLELSVSMHREIMVHCTRRGILFLSTPFEEESADLLDSLGVCGFKIPSGEVTNLPYLRHVAAKGKPLILSTGMATLAEVGAAADVIRSAGGSQLALLHCVSQYPADPADANLRAMDTLSRAFQVPVGFSDHTRGNEVALAAVALGACIVEKHLTLDRALPGPDHAASLEPGELASLVRGIRIVESAIGTGEKRPAASEADTAAVARKSLVAARDIASGTRLEACHVAVRRPGTGISPAELDQVLGREAKVDIRAGAVLAWEMLT